jgi:hypothetical protein
VLSVKCHSFIRAYFENGNLRTPHDTFPGEIKQKPLVLPISRPAKCIMPWDHLFINVLLISTRPEIISQTTKLAHDQDISRKDNSFTIPWQLS